MRQPLRSPTKAPPPNRANLNTFPEPLPGEAAGRVLLLGLGNDLLTDDAIGLEVARAARQFLAEYEKVTVEESLEMGLSLLDLITGFDVLLLVDSIQTKQAPPGFLHDFDANDLSTLPAQSPHFLGIGEVLALGRSLGLQVPRYIRIFAIEVQDPYKVSREMSPVLEAKKPGIVAQIVCYTRKIALRKGPQPPL